MVARCLVDTNILIDYLRLRQPFAAAARKVLILGYVKELELWVSSSQLSDLFYLLSEGGRASYADMAKGEIRSLRKFLHVYPVGEAEVDAAMDSSWRDLEDALVYQAARAAKADVILTRNGKDFAASSIPVYSADELFDWLAKEKGLTYEEVPW